MAYAIKGQLEYQGQKVPILRPDHVSIGKCVSSVRVVRKYSSIHDIDIVNLLKDGCIFKGFKKVPMESAEEEGFANMHFVLLLSNLDETIHKEVCVRRLSKVRFRVDLVEAKNEVLTCINSAVIITFDKKNKKSFYYHFYGTEMKKIELPVDQDIGSWKFVLISNVLFIEKDELFFINFNPPKPVFREVSMVEKEVALVYTNEMIALVNESSKSPMTTMKCDMLMEDYSYTMLLVSERILNILLNCVIFVIKKNNGFIWFGYTPSCFHTLQAPVEGDLEITYTIQLQDMFPLCSAFAYKTSCYCRSTQQVYIVYAKKCIDDWSSCVIVVDLDTLGVSCILELELTVNRYPQIDMHISPSGYKLFVQETFEEKVIFYQVFKMLPKGLTLENIAKQYIWENVEEDFPKLQFLPKHLKMELRDGF